MPDVIYVNADWSAIVPAGSREAAFGVQPRDAKRLGVDQLPTRGAVELPDLPEPEAVETMHSANTSPEPAPLADDEEAKEAPKPADKALRKPADKAARKSRSK